MGVILDSNFYLSLIHPKDPNANRGGEILKELTTGEFGLLYTSNLVIAEAATLVAIRTKGNTLILQDFDILVWGEEKIAKCLFVTPPLEKQTWNLFKKENSNLKSKKDFRSFVDLSSVILAKVHQIDYIVSFDSDFDRFMKRIF